MRPFFPIQRSFLRRPPDAPRRDLRDVDVRGVWGLRVSVFGDGEGDGGEGDGFAEEPAYALLLRVVRSDRSG